MFIFLDSPGKEKSTALYKALYFPPLLSFKNKGISTEVLLIMQAQPCAVSFISVKQVSTSSPTVSAQCLNPVDKPDSSQNDFPILGWPTVCLGEEPDGKPIC